jgi:hypothetical protein
MLNKDIIPSDEFIKEYLGKDSYSNLIQLERFLDEHYDLRKELRFPFGKKYGWGYKYSHRSNHLCHAFFESGAFTITIQLGDACVADMQKILPFISEKANELWKKRYPCGEQGGWIHYRIMGTDELKDIFEVVKIKKKPMG